MNPRILLVLALGATLVTGSAYAENKPRPPVKPVPGRGQPLPKKEEKKQEHTTISSVSEESITTTGAGGAKTYKITKDTEITVKGQKATAADLKDGMKVSVSMGSDPTVASRISATDAPKEDSKEGDKGKGGEKKK
ncbi:MAG TPA: hypothetical protein VGO11_03310 [Chthoniobacteraceae bacterium]|jgi:hypothetical protein|nr:hypothetical protein [Chthoniobacteraceae bacterium]